MVTEHMLSDLLHAARTNVLYVEYFADAATSTKFTRVRAEKYKVSGQIPERLHR